MDGFLACKDCSTVYVYNPKKGTSTLRKHACPNRLLNGQQTITSHFSRKKSHQIPSYILEKIRASEVKFIVDGLRPFNITENKLFREFIENISDASASFGRLDAASILHSTKSLTQDIHDKAEVVRTDLKMQLSNGFGYGLTSDMWKNEFKGHVVETFFFE